tara:strand:- start:57 stop:1499 length:1443 start_codon:yes stop_codon:yes gene_type:complete
MNIADLNWGNDSAEKDPDLMEYFVDSDAYNRVKNLSKEIVIGRKGSGKSALRKRVERHFEGLTNYHIVSVCPKHNAFRSILNDPDLKKGFGQEIFFQQTWIRQLALDSLCLLGHSEKSSYCDGSMAFARDVSLQLNRTSKDFVENISEVLKSVKAKVGDLGEYGVSIEKELRNIADNDSLEHHLAEIAKSGAQIVFTVDDLDLGWDNSTTANNLLLGLLAAMNHLKSLTPNIHYVIFLREDVYEILLTKTQHSDKYRNCERIRWEKNGLVSVLNERINYNRKQHGLSSIENPFETVFPSTIGTSNTDNWLTERTLSRPRELIQFSRYYTESVTGEAPEIEVLKSSEKDYSSWKLDDLSTEYSNQYPNLSAVFSFWKTKFFRHKYHLSRAEVSGMILDILAECTINDQWFAEISDETDVNTMLRILYEIGFLGDFVLGGDGGSQTFYSYTGRHEPILNEVQIHPCFRKAVNTVDRIRLKKP